MRRARRCPCPAVFAMAPMSSWTFWACCKTCSALEHSSQEGKAHVFVCRDSFEVTVADFDRLATASVALRNAPEMPRVSWPWLRMVARWKWLQQNS